MTTEQINCTDKSMKPNDMSESFTALKLFYPDYLKYFLQSCVDDSGEESLVWNYKDLIAEKVRTNIFVHLSPIEDPVFDDFPNGEDIIKILSKHNIRTIGKYCSALSDQLKDEFIELHNKTVFEFFNGNVNASWKDY